MLKMLDAAHALGCVERWRERVNAWIEANPDDPMTPGRINRYTQSYYKEQRFKQAYAVQLRKAIDRYSLVDDETKAWHADRREYGRALTAKDIQAIGEAQREVDYMLTGTDQRAIVKGWW